MILSKLLEMDMGEAVDWLIENHQNFELVPNTPSHAMREAYHDAQEAFEDCIGESPDSHWTAMLHAHRLSTLGKLKESN